MSMNQNARRVTTYTDFVESTEAATPGSNVARMGAVDRDGLSTIYVKDDLGRVSYFSALDRAKTRKDFSIVPSATSNGLASSMGSQFTIAGTFTSVAHADALRGAHRNIATDGTLDFDSGIFGTNLVTALNMNPEIRVRFARVTATKQRIAIGFFASTPMGAAANSIIQFGLVQDIDHDSGKFQIMHSATADAPTEIDLGAADTAVHEIYLIADNTNSRWGYKWDNATSITWVSTNVPLATAGLAWYSAQRGTEAQAKSWKFWHAIGSVDV